MIGRQSCVDRLDRLTDCRADDRMNFAVVPTIAQCKHHLRMMNELNMHRIIRWSCQFVSAAHWSAGLSRCLQAEAISDGPRTNDPESLVRRKSKCRRCIRFRARSDSPRARASEFHHIREMVFHNVSASAPQNARNEQTTNWTVYYWSFTLTQCCLATAGIQPI